MTAALVGPEEQRASLTVDCAERVGDDGVEIVVSRRDRGGDELEKEAAVVATKRAAKRNANTSRPAKNLRGAR